MQKGPVPEGRSIGSIVPLGRGIIDYTDDSRHFVPGFPPGENYLLAFGPSSCRAIQPKDCINMLHQSVFPALP
jgi:hypothetical protein